LNKKAIASSKIESKADKTRLEQIDAALEQAELAATGHSALL